MLGSSTTTGTMPRVNLLPPEIAEKAALRRSQVAMAGVGVAAVAVVGVLYMNATAKVNDAKADRDAAVATGTALNAELRTLQNVRDVYARVDAARATLSSAMATEILWSGYLHDLTLTIPENVWLTNMTAAVGGQGSTSALAAPTTAGASVLDPGVGSVTFTGRAFEHNDVASWLESLAKQKGYANAYFTQSVKSKIGARGIVEFSSTVNLTPAALANRYSKGTAR